MRPGDGYEERGFLQKYGFGLGIGLVGIVCLALVLNHGGHSAPPLKTQEIVMIKPLAPTPPPPTPPPTEPPREIEKMIEQTPMDKPEEKPDDSPKAPDVTTNVTGSGSDAFGLGAGGHGGGGLGGRRGSRWGWYATEVSRLIKGALDRSAVISKAEFNERIKIWADASGRVTHLKLEMSTGRSDLDQAISEAIEGLQLQEPPPAGMPMPINMRISGTRKA